MNYCVYMHISPSNKKYVGITSQKPKKRWSNGYGYKKNQYFYRAIEKYGWDNFEHIIIARGLTKEEAEWLEVELIRVNDSANRNKGYNIDLGGNSIGKLSEETKQKMSLNNAKPNLGKHLPEETKRKMSESHKGKNNPKSKPVICITTMTIFDTARDGADYYNTQNQSIAQCCSGKRKSAGKYNNQKLVWKYIYIKEIV